MRHISLIKLKFYLRNVLLVFYFLVLFILDSLKQISFGNQQEKSLVIYNTLGCLRSTLLPNVPSKQLLGTR